MDLLLPGDVKPLCNRFFKLRVKKVKFLCHIKFLLRCKKDRLIPSFIRCRTSLASSPRIRRTMNNNHNALLRSVIQDTRYHLSNVEKELYTILRSLWLYEERFHFGLYEFDQKIAIRCDNLVSKLTAQHNKKFDKLAHKSHRPATEHRCNSQTANHGALPNPVVNISSRQLSPNEERCLQLGLNFSVSTTPSVPDILAPIENTLQRSRITPQQKDVIRFLIAETVEANRHCNTSNLNRSEKQALNGLKSDPGIVICKADKGGQIVVMDRTKYSSSVETLIESGPYTKIKGDPAASNLKQIRSSINASPIIADTMKFHLIPLVAH